MTRNIYVSQSWNGGDGQFYWDPNSENITIALFYDAQRTSNVSVANFTIGTLGSVCNTSSIDIPRMMVNASCASLPPISHHHVYFPEGPFPWSAVPSDGLLITANFTDAGGVLYVKPGQGAASDVDTYTESIPLISGSHLSAVLGVTQRQIFSKKKLDYLGFTSLRKITVRSVLLVQADPSLHEPQLDTLSLRLLPRGDLPGFTKIVQDYTDASVLAGFANLGGFWTFVNGTFALVFGANLAYFLLGIRPLSPLGFVHFFQRRAALMDKWHQDFPKLRTEGGGRGSPLAGVVAFLRERLVHADEDVEAAFVTRYVDAQGKYYGFSAS
ncbi:hypothetical protein DFH09DRAFT_1073888 [Mycena vulgaris]|nr:hypothetical protein DFH09DRAFT_1073888 [Mycena vulgaris]